MLSDDIVTALRQAFLFSAFDDSQIKRIAASTVEIRLDEGAMLFEQGQEAERFYLLLEGRIKLYRLSEEGDEKVVEIIKPGRTFAEAVMFMSGHAYPVNADALCDSRLLAFSNATFMSLAEESFETCKRLMAVMSQRMHWHLQEIDKLTLHNATYRLVSYLLSELPEETDGEAHILLNAPKHVIASRLSIKPETLSRIFNRLVREGIIESHGNDILVKDLPGLKALLEI
ncbi:MAG TPA: Crp/Fnr family transcriptional regulator [Thiotrichales bacterium]|nr:Crp/Fnr family transcriptional regulator [Thiotrichales bacterium]